MFAGPTTDETLPQGGPRFPNRRKGGAWPSASFRHAWEKECKAAGLPVLKPYETLRHSTATEWMRRRASEREVQELLGHRTRHAAPRYARLADERLESIVGRVVGKATNKPAGEVARFR